MDLGSKLLEAFVEWANERVGEGEAEPYISGESDGWACLDAHFDLNAIASLFLTKLGEPKVLSNPHD